MLSVRNNMSYSIAILFFIWICSIEADVTVEIANGKLLGAESQNADKTRYYTFQGIPFAKPPLGDLRFEAPVEPDNWEGTLDVRKRRIVCHQLSSDDPTETEDCLIVNVYTPELPNQTTNVSLPVMVFIYGGGFIAGSSSDETYGPDYFMNYGVVFVTFNYRVGPFGFLSTQDLVIPGNYGLKDQALALKWVQKNIQHFGGDPTKVTLFGESAGSASVGFHVISQQSAGLFRGAIMESGSALSPWAMQRRARAVAFRTGNLINPNINIGGTTSEQLKEFLKQQSASEIKAVASSLISSDGHPEYIQILQGFYYAVVIEPEHDGAFISANMYEILEAGNINTVPIIAGINSEELVYFSGNLDFLRSLAVGWDANPNFLVPLDFHLEEHDDRVKVGNEIRKNYVGNDLLQNNLGATVKLLSDTSMGKAVMKSTAMLSKYTDVYLYEFSYNGPLGSKNYSVPGTEKVSHGDEMYYLFHSADRPDLSVYPPEDIITLKRMLTMWTNFAKYLNPTSTNDDLLQNVSWPKVSRTNDNMVYLNINTNLQVSQNLYKDRYDGWDVLYKTYAVPPFDTY